VTEIQEFKAVFVMHVCMVAVCGIRNIHMSFYEFEGVIQLKREQKDNEITPPVLTSQQTKPIIATK